MKRSFIPTGWRNLPPMLALSLFFSFVPGASAQTATNIQVTSTVQASSVKRLGVNLGDQTFYDSSQMLKNLIFQNPGFEPEKFRSIMICGVAGGTTCTDDNQYSPQPTGFWNGATVLVMTGSQAGKTAKIVSSTKNSGTCSGCGQIMQFDQNLGLAVGDYFSVTQNFPGNGQQGWWTSTSGGATITSETNDLSTETAGTQALAVNASGSGQSAAVTSYFDGEDGISFIQLNGAFAITFRAKGIGGSNQLAVNFQRTSSSGNTVYVNKTLTLTKAWQDYTITFNASETGSTVGTAQLVFSVSGASAELDDVALEQTNSSASNTTAFRDDVVNTLNELKPGTIRMMAGDGALGSDLINQIQVPGKRYREGWSTGHTETDVISYGIHEFLQLCQAVNADPWITIPTATTPAEMTAFIQYLTGTGGDQYSALRISRGQTAPWTSVFNKIHLELGNETWNGSFRGESMTYDGYPYWANTVFGAARSTSGYVASKFDLVLDGLAASPGYNAVLLQRSTKHDSIDGAPYLLFSANNEAQSTMFGALFAEPEVFDAAGGEMYQQVTTAKAAATPTYVNVYETNLSPIEGSITKAQLDNLTPSIGAGLAHTEHMLQMMRDGVVYQNAFSLPQYAFLRSDGLTVKLWGIVRDMGTTNRRRPQFLTQAMANAVVGGNMLQTTHTGANPTWNQPLSSDNVQLNGAHYLQSFAFQNGSNVSVIVFNLSQTTALPVTFSGNAPSGSVEMTQITSANITDNNEDSEVVAPTTKTLSGFDPSKGLTLPPFSMTVLTAAGTTTMAPTFTPAGGTYTSAQSVTLADGTSGATIYYTTDGSTPTTSSTKYTGAITVSKNETLNAIAVASGLSASSMSTATYTIGAAQTAAATPAFSVAGGTYSTAQTVSISDATSGAAIYYTTNGATPTSSSTRYTGAISISSTETLKAIAVASGYSNSAVASATYTISSLTAASNPVFSVAGGTYTSTQTVTITDVTKNSTIHYTTDGSTPTVSSPKYTSALTIKSTTTLKAMATATNYTNSGVTSATYTINSSSAALAAPKFSAATGTYNNAFKLTLTEAMSGAKIYYSIDGASPVVYTAPIAVNKSMSIRAAAVNPTTNETSAVTTNTYTLQAATPAFSVAGGSYSSAQTVTISDATSGAAIYYTTNGAAPTTSSAKYTGAIKVSATETLKAIAAATNFSNSGVASASYTINSAKTAATPVFSVAGGSYASAQTVSISDATSGAAIYYTTNGSTPTTSSAKYAGAIKVSATETLKAIAAASGYSNSAVASATYTIQSGATPAPQVSYGTGTYSGPVTETITDSVAGANIYYTVNGGAAIMYTGPVKVSSSMTLTAYAYGPGMAKSAVITAAITIQPPAAPAPKLTYGAGTYTGSITETITDSAAGATIYYQVNGGAAIKYTGPFAVDNSMTLTTYAYATGMSKSAVVTAPITIQAIAPTFSVAPGTYATTQLVSLASKSVGSTIYYTTDGTTPTTSSKRYSGFLTVNSSTTVKAIAQAANTAPSAVSSATYTVTAKSK